ncbi:MAG: SPASM domain-containing protein [Nitrospirae bacterium]|nr:SPASM domain-containing protein [Nitrospirota bacterium]
MEVIPMNATWYNIQSNLEQKEMFVKDSTLNVNYDNTNQKLIALKGDKFREYRQKWEATYKTTTLIDFPLHIDFETVYGCNYHCAICHLNYIYPQATDFMSIKKLFDFNLFKKIIDEGLDNGLCAITVNNVGEPLLRDDIDKFIYYATDRGVLDIWMSTNGSLLSSEMAKKLIISGLTRINISLDAATESTYLKIRKSKNLKKVIKNIHDLIELRDKLGSVTPVVKVSFCVTNINEHEVDEFIALWKPHVDAISIQQYWDANKVTDLTAHNRVIEKFNCLEPFHRLAINVDGTVSPCCLIWRDGFLMGDAKESSIHDVWHSDKMNRLRQSIITGEFPEEFHKCVECIESRF